MDQTLVDIAAVLEALIAGDLDHARVCLATLREHAAAADAGKAKSKG